MENVKKKSKFLYFDTETTDVQIKDLIQLAFITDDEDIWFNEFYKPRQEITPMAMSIHNVTPEMLADKPMFEDGKLPKEHLDPDFKGKTLKEYLEFLAKEYIWVAHNSAFDVEVMEKKGIKIPKIICTLKLARHSISNGKKDYESYRLQFLRYSLGLYKNEDNDHVTAHDALSDVYFLRDLFHYIQDTTSLTPEQMMLITREPQVMRELRFGKYSGMLLYDIAKIDRPYLEWLVENMTGKDDLVWNVRRVLESNLDAEGNQTLF